MFRNKPTSNIYFLLLLTTSLAILVPVTSIAPKSKEHLKAIQKSTNPLPSDLACPPKDPTNTCDCTSEDGAISLVCDGENTTQPLINKLLTEFRTLNEQSANEILTIAAFAIFTTNLTEVDLSLLKNFKVDYLIIFGNFQLVSIVAPSFQTSLEHKDDVMADPPFLLESSRVDVSHAALDHVAVSNFLTLLSPATLNQFDMGYNFNVRRVTTRQFQRFTNLSSLVITSCNVNLLEPEAFFFDELVDDGQPLAIGLRWNTLSNGDIAANTSFPLSTKKQISLNLNFNSFTFISEDRFQAFLDSNTLNNVTFDDNGFECGESMKWLHDGKDKYESRVDGVICKNDYPHTIFDTTIFDPPTTTTTTTRMTTESSAEHVGGTVMTIAFSLFLLIICLEGV